MITAKNEFFLEREMISELQQIAYEAGLSSHEQEEVFGRLEGITSEGFEAMKKELIEKKTHPLNKIRDGKTLSAKEINQAVKKAADNE